ncbi:MAG: hypothetical protein J5693_01945 [Bacteroidales bacterium]|nr:hypothetical protein [Bacteroidales bacterium]
MKKTILVIAAVLTALVLNGREKAPKYINLSEAGNANCYVVSAPGYYCFDVTVIGNGQQGIMSGARFHTASAAIAPASAKILLNQNDVLANVLFDGSKIYFTAGEAEGNAQIGVYDADGKCLWSWHIWRTDAPLDFTYTNSDEISWTVMDRNLGATSREPKDGAEAFGLYYQWGRKDPFPVVVLAKGMYVNSERTIAYSVEHPRQAFKPVAYKDVYDAFDWYNTHKDSTNHALWGNPDFEFCRPLKDMVKTIYDPCPAGYVVAPANAFRDFECDDKMEYGDRGFFFDADGGKKIYFPYSAGTYSGPALPHIDRNGQKYFAVWNSSTARFVYWDDGGSRTVVLPDKREARLWYGDSRACLYPVRCVKQAQ